MPASCMDAIRRLIPTWAVPFGYGPSSNSFSNPEWAIFFSDADDGSFIARWVLPRVQSATENCTIHNWNPVPVAGRRILVTGGFQAGTSVVGLARPRRPVEIAWSDPPPLTPAQFGGAWSSYWYDGLIYERDVTEGLNVFRLAHPAVAGALTLGHLNPQTLEFRVP